MLFYFILGILFVSIVFPITSFFASFLDIYTEYITYVFTYKVYKIKTLMKSNQEEQQDSNFQMGFHTDVIGVKTPQQEQIEQEDY